MKKFNWSILLVGFIALAVLATTGCVSKKRKASLPDDPTTMQGELMYDENGLPYYLDENGNRVYIDDPNALGDRSGSEIGGGFEPVLFTYDNSQIDPAEMSKIDTVVAYLNDNAAYGLVIEGHCDERGSNEYNLALGERRALAVRAAIISAGIDASRITTRSYGEENPVAMGHDESSWAMNRRAEFIVTQ